MFANSNLLRKDSLILVNSLFNNAELLTYDGYSITTTTVSSVSNNISKSYYQITVNTGERFLVSTNSQLLISRYPEDGYDYLYPIEIQNSINEQLNLGIYELRELAFISPFCNNYGSNLNELCDYVVPDGAITLPQVNKLITNFSTPDLCEVPPYWYGVFLTKELKGIEPIIEVGEDIYLNMKQSCLGQESPSVYKTNGGMVAFKSPRINATRTKLSLDLENLGLLGVSVDERDINNAYLFSSFNDRVKVLKGILDSIGLVDLRTNAVKLTLWNRRVLEDVALLVRSISGEAIFESQYTLNIQVPPNVYPFSIPSKTALYVPQEVTYYPRYIVSVQLIGDLSSRQITTSSPSNTVLLTDTNNSMYIPIKA